MLNPTFRVITAATVTARGRDRSNAAAEYFVNQRLSMCELPVLPG
jgi:hypothetical protein